jgi:hypothetical protein
MIPSFGIDPFDDRRRRRPQAGVFVARLVPRAMARTVPEALMVLGLSALAVTGCTIVIETPRSLSDHARRARSG